MTVLTWDNAGEHLYEAGVDHGVLYIPDSQGAYVLGVPWNGLTNVNETPTGGEPTAQWADNQKYLNLFSVEEFGATIEAYTYPEEFNQFDGLATPEAGVYVGQQNRKIFGLSYRTKVGNDIEFEEYGYKLHLVYGCQASPSERSYSTINDSPEAINPSWDLTTTPVPVTGMKPTALMIIDSTKVDAAALVTLENFLYGTAGTDASLPLPDDVIALFSGTATEATPSVPAFDNVDDITIPSVTGVTYYVNDVAVPAGSLIITEDTVVTARPDTGYYFPAGVDDDWLFVYGG